MNKIIYFLLFVFLAQPLWASEKEQKKRMTPYELMSNYYTESFNPFKKGNAYTGFAFSLTTRDLENTNLLLLNIDDGDNKDYKLIFKGGYFIGDYNMLGLEASYVHKQFEGHVALNGEQQLQQQIKSLGTIRPVLATYFPLSKSNRLAFYNKMGMGFSFGNTLKRTTGETGNISKSYEDNFEFSLGLSPGVTFFLLQNFALEVELGNLVGYSYYQTKTIKNGTEVSTRQENKVNFDVNLLQLRLGIAYYINRQKKK